MLLPVALLALCGLVPCWGKATSSESYTPKLKWWQTESSLYFDVEVRCADGGAEAAAVSDGVHFSLECVDDKGRVARLGFELREPVVAPSTCKSIRGGKTRCSLTKKLPHRFDRLSWDAEVLRTVAKIDYERWEADESEASESSTPPTDYANVPQILAIDDHSRKMMDASAAELVDELALANSLLK